MTNKLKLIIEKSGIDNVNGLIVRPCESEDVIDGYHRLGVNDIIFSHYFAKAYWGEESLDNGFPAWQYHLQEMVLEEDPIEYLAKFLDNKN